MRWYSPIYLFQFISSPNSNYPDIRSIIPYIIIFSHTIIFSQFPTSIQKHSYQHDPRPRLPHLNPTSINNTTMTPSIQPCLHQLNATSPPTTQPGRSHMLYATPPAWPTTLTPPPQPNLAHTSLMLHRLR